MRTSIILLAGLLVAVLVGCVTPPIATADLNCRNTPDCRVQVSVSCSMTIFCNAAVDHDRVLSKANGQIVWELQNPAYTFDRTNGIVFASAQAVFSCHVEANGRRFSCTNRGDPGQFKYTVNLVGSPAAGPLDPWVVND